MGNACCKGASEERKPSAFQVPESDIPEPQASFEPPPSTAAASYDQQEERAAVVRVNQIVNSCGRQMIPVRSSRGVANYYDQGFAAALRSHLEQTTRFPPMPTRLPPACSKNVPEILGAAPWHDIKLGQKSGLANCGGENPVTYMDRLAESYLDEILPKRELMFRKAPAIVENLL